MEYQLCHLHIFLLELIPPASTLQTTHTERPPPASRKPCQAKLALLLDWLIQASSAP